MPLNDRDGKSKRILYSKTAKANNLDIISKFVFKVTVKNSGCWGLFL